METINATETMKTITETKGDLVQIINGLFNVQNLAGKEFSLKVSKNINIAESKLEEIIQEETANVLIKKAIEAKKNADRSFEEGYYDAARIYINSAINLLQKTIKTSGSQEAKKLLLQFKIFKNDHRL